MTVVRLESGETFDARRHTLMFTHIPKCGGTSLTRMFEDAFGEGYRHFCNKPGETDNLENVFAGGGHRNFSAGPLHARAEVVYITVIREPVARFVSNYRHIRDHPEHRFRRQFPGIHEMRPLEFARTLHQAGAPEVSNLQARMLAPKTVSANEAIAHITANYSIVGVLEQIDEFVERLRRMFPDFRFKQTALNVSQAGTPELDAETIAFVRSINELDIAIYRHFYGFAAA